MTDFDEKEERALGLYLNRFFDFDVKAASFFAFVLKSLFFAKKHKNKGFGCFGSNCFRKIRKSSYFNTKYLDFKNYLYGIRHYCVIYTKVINRTSIKSFREAVTQQKRTAPPGVDAAETVRFSWKVVEPQGQREHDVRVSR